MGRSCKTGSAVPRGRAGEAARDRLGEVAIIGANGQIGAELVRILGRDADAYARSRLDLGEPGEIADFVRGTLPPVIVNAAGFTEVDAAEDSFERALRINATAVEELARAAFAQGRIFVHYSSDYVFSGAGDRPWPDDANLAPVNAYGRSKAEGERALRRAANSHSGSRYLNLRTSWVYSHRGRNFVNTMLAMGRQRTCIRVVDDQIGAPSYASDIADCTLQILNRAVKLNRFPSGTYNLCNLGETSWFGFAQAIFSRAQARGCSLRLRDLRATDSSRFPQAALRPHNSRLCTRKLREQFGLVMPPWQSGLDRCLAQLWKRP